MVRVSHCAASEQQTLDSSSHLLLIRFLSAARESEKHPLYCQIVLDIHYFLHIHPISNSPALRPCLDSMGRPSVRPVVPEEIDYSLLQPLVASESASSGLELVLLGCSERLKETVWGIESV